MKLLFFFIFSFLTIPLFADILYLKTGEIKKGVVLEETAEKIIFTDGNEEKQILKSNIDNIKYDSKEENYLNLGNTAKAKQQYRAALKYYEIALQSNPESKKARESILSVRNILFKETNFQKTLELKKQTRGTKKTGIKERDFSKELEDFFGFTLEKKDQAITINYIRPDSPVYAERLRVGDQLIRIEDKKISHEATLDQILSLLMNDQREIISFEIERHIVILRGKPSWWFFNNSSSKAFDTIDAKIKFENNDWIFDEIEKDGRADLAGVKNKDIIEEIEGITKEYLTLKEIENKIQGQENSKLNMIIKRSVSLKRSSKQGGYYEEKIEKNKSITYNL